MFSINQPLFLQKNKPLHPNPNIYLGLGFEFGPQRIRDFSLCMSVVRVDCHRGGEHFLGEVFSVSSPHCQKDKKEFSLPTF